MSRIREIFTTSLTDSNIWLRIAIDVLVVASVVWFDVSPVHLTALFWLDLLGACLCFSFFMSAGELWFIKVLNVVLGFFIPLTVAPLLFAAIRVLVPAQETDNPVLYFYPYYDLSLYFIGIWTVQSANYRDFMSHREKAIIPFAGYIAILLFSCIGFPITVAFLWASGLSNLVAIVVALGIFRTAGELLRRRQLIVAYHAAPTDHGEGE